jgi:hypothetical protein
LVAQKFEIRASRLLGRRSYCLRYSQPLLILL